MNLIQKEKLNYQQLYQLKKAEIGNLLNNYNKSDYSDSGYASLEQIINNAKAAVDLLTDISAVENYDLAAVETLLDGVKTLSEEILDAKSLLEQALNDYLDSLGETNPSAEVEAIITNAVASVNETNYQDTRFKMGEFLP